MYPEHLIYLFLSIGYEVILKSHSGYLLYRDLHPINLGGSARVRDGLSVRKCSFYSLWLV